MDVRGVREAVRQGRAIRAPGAHAGKHGIGFAQVLVALERCYHVAPDGRTGPGGAVLHPRGWFALANLPNRRRLRIDFDVHEDASGALLLIVTAYPA